MVGGVSAYNPYSSMFPGTVIASTGYTATSPQAPENPTLDKVELGVKSLIVGKMAAKSAIHNFEFGTIKQGELNTGGMMFKTGWKTAKSGALVGGAVSLARNIYHMAQGDVNVARASGNVVSDIAGGAVGGLLAGAGAGLAVSALSKSSGFMMGTAGLIVGAVGFALADTVYHQTGAREAVSDAVTGVIDRLFDNAADQGGV